MDSTCIKAGKDDLRELVGRSGFDVSFGVRSNCLPGGRDQMESPVHLLDSCPEGMRGWNG